MNLISIFKTPIMEFLIAEEDFEILPHPVPAGKHVPDWFKKISPTAPAMRDHFGGAAMTAKKCMPLLDAMTSGYIVPLYGDVNIRTNKDCSLIEASKNPYGGEIVAFHDKVQLGGKTSPTYPGPAIKFVNKWVIKTAPGWSTLFVPCLNSLEKRFTCLSAIVDTDKYPKQVNFPAIWNVPDFDGILEAGTPLITCIPVKRSALNQGANVRVLTQAESKVVTNLEKSQMCRSHVYTKELREKR